MDKIKLFEEFTASDINYVVYGYEHGKYYPRTPADAWRQLYMDDLFDLGFVTNDPVVKERPSDYGGVHIKYTYNGHGTVGFKHPDLGDDVLIQFENGSFRVVVYFYDDAKDKRDWKSFWGYTYHDFNSLMDKLSIDAKVTRYVYKSAARFFMLDLSPDVKLLG
jgi:hypothetical protein